MEYAIELKEVTKKYKLYKSPKERFLDFTTPLKYGKDFYALRNVDFQAEKGEAIGFVGINGSGKSTLSNIISGIIPETNGEVIVNGETSIIAVNAGMKDDLTGRENLRLKCLMLGFSPKQIQNVELEIIDFSELDEFIDQPFKSYSSGMKSRLGFSISVHVNSDILIIDEALSVGDKTFYKKSIDKMNEFKKQGKTIIFVSHNHPQIRQFCDKVLWLEFGKVKSFGPSKEVMDEYETFFKEYDKLSDKEKKEFMKKKMS